MPDEEKKLPQTDASEEPKDFEYDEKFKEHVAGGNTIKAKETPVNEETSDSSMEEKSKIGQAAETGKEIAKQKVADIVKKRILKKLTRQALKKAALALVVNPYFWIVVAVIIIAGIIVLIFLSVSGSLSNVSPNPFGASATRPVDPVKDKGTLETFLANAGDEDVVNKMSFELVDGLIADLVQLKNEATNPDIIAKIDNAIALLEEANNTKNPDTAKRAITAIKEIIILLENPIPQFPGNTRLPLDNISGFNQTLHGGTPLNSEIVEGHNTYIHYNDGTCDATDLFAEQDSPVYPVFSGNVVRVGSDGDWGYSRITVEKDGYEIVYAHLKSDSVPQINSNVTTNDVIGLIAKDRLHIEASYKGLCIVTTTVDNLNKSPEKDWGEYLWDHIKRIFKI